MEIEVIKTRLTGLTEAKEEAEEYITWCQNGIDKASNSLACIKFEIRLYQQELDKALEKEI